MSLQLQSFVVAAIVAAILLADRLGSETLPRRLYQVSLGFALVFVVVGGTGAFMRSEGGSLFSSLLSGQANAGAQVGGGGPSADKAVERASVQAGIALLFLLAGFLTFRRYTTLPLAFVLGGLLLLLASGGSGSGDFSSSLSSLSGIFGGLFGQARQSRDITYFVVLMVGTLLLIGYGYQEWEGSSARGEASAPP